jgi:hypothetical protein
MSQDTLKVVYYSYFSSTMTYGIIFCGSSSYSIVFRLQKRVFRIITGARSTDSCRGFFKKLKTSHFHSQYILSFLLFVVNNKDQYKVNSEIKVSTLDRTLTFNKHYKI